MSAPSIINLPPKIENIIIKILSGVDTNKWVDSAIQLSSKYRLNRNIQDSYDDVFLEKANDVLGYLALRTPATYAQLYGAMYHITEVIPSWKPISILDIGSGPGTAVWAASNIWPSINNITCLEKNSNFSKIGKKILQSSLPKSVNLDWRTVDLSVSKPTLNTKFDLVTIGSVLNEMVGKQRNDILEFAYNHCQGLLLVVEPGTPYGFKAVKQASTLLHSHKGTLIAPYIDNSLVLSDQEQIGFAQRIIRPEFHRRIRQIQRKLNNPDGKRVLPASDWEKAKYSYVAMSTLPSEISPYARLIAKPKKSKLYIELKILTKNGVETQRVLRRDKSNYKFAKKLKWGDLLMPNYASCQDWGPLCNDVRTNYQAQYMQKHLQLINLKNHYIGTVLVAF